MSKIKKSGLIVAGLLLLCLSWFYFENPEKKDFKVKKRLALKVAEMPEEEKLKEEDETENPQKRLEYEFDMLKDPSTGKIPEGIRSMEIAFANSMKDESVGIFNIRSSVAGVTKSQASDFINRGPFNIGGRTRALAFDVSDESIILAGGVSGGLYRSTDSGDTWTRTTSLDQIHSISSLIQDKRSGKTQNWYFGSGEFTGNSASTTGAFYFGDGIFRSTNGGQSWTVVPGTNVGSNVRLSRFAFIHNLAIDNSNTSQTEIYVAVHSQIIRTIDDFATTTIVLGADNTNSETGNWTDVAVSPTGAVIAIISNQNSNGASAQEGLFRSTDGVTWNQIILPTDFPTRYARVKLSYDPTDENFFYALGVNYMFKYDIANGTWTNLTEGIEVSSDSGEGFNAQGGYNLVVEGHPADANTVFVGGTNLTRSLDGFATRTTNKNVGGYRADGNPNSFPQYTNHHPDIHVVTFKPSDPNVMLTGTDGGVHLTNNSLANTGAAPIVWNSLNNGYITSQFYAIDYFRQERGNLLIIGGLQDNGTWATFSDDPTSSWDELFGGDGAFSGVNYNSLFVSSQDGNVARYESVNNVYQFRGNISPSDDDAEFLFINPFIVDRVGQDRLYVGARGKIYYTSDIRENPGDGEWEEIAGVGMSNQFVSALATSVQPEGVLYFGTRNGRLQKVTNTRTFESITNITGTNLPSGSITSIAVDPRNADRVFVTFGNYGIVSVWMSEDGGTTWSSISGNLEENPSGAGNGPSVRSIEILPNGTNGELVFVGTSTGLYMTNNLAGDQTVWNKEANDVIGNAVVTMVKVRPIDGEVVVSTHGNGVYIGSYDVAFHPEINYSLNGEDEAVLRAPISFIPGAGFIYNWYKDDVLIPNESDFELTVTESGTYKAEVFDELGPSAFTNEIILEFEETVTANDSPFEVTSKVKPNPSAGIFTINLGADFASGFSYTLVDSNGNQISFGEQAASGTNIDFTLDITNKPDGLYILNVSNDKRAETLKLLKQRN